MNAERATSFVTRAIKLLDHVGARTKTEKAAVASIREMLDAAEFELTSEPLPPLEVPTGARQGISVEPRAEWRRR